MTERGRWFLVRHGEDLSNQERSVNGMLNHPLTPTGIIQAEKAGEILKPHDIHIIVYSPLDRAWETAKIIAQKTKAQVLLQNYGLYEMNYGALTGLRTVDVLAYAEAHPEQTLKTDYDRTFVLNVPGMESLGSVYNRVSASIELFKEKYLTENIAFVGHGISLCMLYAVCELS